MGRNRIVNCKRCGRHIDEVGPLSQRKLCESCSEEAVYEVNRALMASNGLGVPAWVDGMKRALERDS